MDVSNKWCTREGLFNLTFTETDFYHDSETKSWWWPFHQDTTSALGSYQKANQVLGIVSTGLKNKARRYHDTAWILNGRCSSGPQVSKGIWRSRQGAGDHRGMPLQQYFGSDQKCTFETHLPITAASHTAILISSWATWAGFSEWI